MMIPSKKNTAIHKRDSLAFLNAKKTIHHFLITHLSKHILNLFIELRLKIDMKKDCFMKQQV